MARTLVKICGITRPEDALAAREAGADAIGMVFYPPSPRYVADIGLAREIAQAAGPFVASVALFVNAEPADIDRVLAAVPLHVLQFHGGEDDGACAVYQRPYIKALRVKPGMDLSAEIDRYPAAQAILLDSYVAGVPGGTGEQFNWGLVPAEVSKPLVLAGGLSPANVGEAIAAVKPYAVDVSGGVESRPGVKDREKIQAFVRNAKRGAVK